MTRRSSKPLISESLQDVAKAAGLQSYEIPRDFIIETTPFTLENGLLTGIRKLARPKLKEHYGDRLEQLYADLADGQADELRELRQRGADGPVLETVIRAAGALLGAAAADLQPDAHFTDLGGDSLSALTFANLLHEIFDIDVPVGVIVSPASDLAALAAYIETERRPGTKRPTFASVHGRDATEVHAGDLTLDKFIDAETLAAAPSLPGPSAEVRTVLLTGATGFLGRYLALEWLERMDLVDGKVICLVRAKDDAAARERLDETFDSGDPELLRHYRELAADHLEVIAGDKGEANLGLDPADVAAARRHRRPDRRPRGAGQPRAAVQPAVRTQRARHRRADPHRAHHQDQAVRLRVDDRRRCGHRTRQSSPRTATSGSSAPPARSTTATPTATANSKWAGEVLLREAHDLCGLPVSVFRCDMILADTTYAGQLNVPDMFTRMMLSLVATGIAPASFYELDADGNRQRAHYDGLPVEFIAEAISTLVRAGGRRVRDVPRDEPVRRRHRARRVRRLADRSGLPGRSESATTPPGCSGSRRRSVLCPSGSARRRCFRCCTTTSGRRTPIRGSIAPTDRFRAAVQDAKIGPDKDIPHVTPEVIVKYVTDLQLLGLL